MLFKIIELNSSSSIITDPLDIITTTESYPLSYISQNIIRPNITNISYKSIDYNFINGTDKFLYKYRFTFYNSQTFEESSMSNTLNVITYYKIGTDITNLRLYLDLFFNNFGIPNYYYINIYRNNTTSLQQYNNINYISDDDNYVLIDTLPISETTYRDTIIITNGKNKILIPKIFYKKI
jgi:hypothetical protein